MAELYRAQGRPDAARPLYERALAIVEKALGPDHPETIRIRAALARLDAAGRERRAAPAAGLPRWFKRIFNLDAK